MTDPQQQIKSIFAPGGLATYIEANAKDPHPYLSKIREDCQNHKWGFMVTSRDQAAFLYSLAKISRAKKILEIGCYFGHSTLALASALPNDGKIISIEHNPKFAKIALEHMAHAAVSNRVEFLVGEAPHVLPRVAATHQPESFDLIFIDADKRHFPEYWESAMNLARTGGIIVFDNALARGDVTLETSDANSHVAAVREFNARVLEDSRAFSFIASISDGMLVAIKN